MAPLSLVRMASDEGVAVVTMCSVSNRNALSRRMVIALHEAITNALQDPSVIAIVLTGEGPAFCAGADLKEDRTLTVPGPSFVDLLECLLEAPKPIVAVLNGTAHAGGIGLVAAAQIALARNDTSFSFPETRIGVVPAIIAVPCLARMSERAASRYFVTGETFDAKEAVRIGLLTASAEPEDFDGLVKSVLDGLRQGAPMATAKTMKLLRSFPAMSRAEAFGWTERLSADAFASSEAAEGRAAFSERRKPIWIDQATTGSRIRG